MHGCQLHQIFFFLVIQIYRAKINSKLHITLDVGANTKQLPVGQAVIVDVVWGINYNA